MDIRVEQMCDLLERARLLPREDVFSLRKRWFTENAEVAADPDRFVAWLVTQRYVTEFQAGRLRKGQADRYFLGDYKVLDRIGYGSMAGVYKAAHPLGQVVAIKVLPPSKAKDAEQLARFKREARLALRLTHPNVVRTFQAGEADGLHYLVMEHLEGETLAEALRRRGKLPPAEAVRLVYQALLGLQHIHEQDLIHRDLNPDNLMLVPAGGDTTLQTTVKVLDIGLGRALFDESGEQGGDLTQPGDLLGVGDYRAPEQTRDARSVDIRADIYSLGCVLYKALAGQPPFPDSNPVRQIQRHATETPSPLREFNSGVSDELDRVVSTMLAKDPALRYPTPQRAAEALQALLTRDQQPRFPEVPPQMQAYLAWLAATAPRDGAPTPAAGIPVSRPNGKAPSTNRRPRRSLDQPERRRVSRWLVALVVLAVLGTGVTVAALLRHKIEPHLPAWIKPTVTASPEALAKQAHAILQKHCHRCHGKDGAAEGNFNYVLDRERLVSRGKVRPGDARESRLFKLVAAHRMPPENEKDRLADSDVAVLEKWIDVGAPAIDGQPPPPYLGFAYVVEAIHADLQKLPADQRKQQRYFTLANIANDPQRRKDLPLYRAALAKLVNSLSWEPKLVVPRPADAEQIILAINVRDVGWEKNDLWGLEVLGSYPYGLRHDGAGQPEGLQTAAKAVYQQTGTKQPFVRADWFLARASRPPLYHALLSLPEKGADLEKRLGVDFETNFRTNKLMRAGYLTSGISKQNRLVERHPARDGAYYWKSYDFAASNQLRNLLTLPLGPQSSSTQRFSSYAFRHDGGEIIFQLPNGLQGYLLVDRDDNRINEAPRAIVADEQHRFSGSDVIVTGISCMGCHAVGVLDGPERGDAVRSGFNPPATTGKALPKGAPGPKVKGLYPENPAVAEQIKKDREQFQKALTAVTGAFGAEPAVEPITTAARPFDRDLGLGGVAAELCVEDPARIAAALAADTALAKRLEVAALLGDEKHRGQISRTLWEQVRGDQTVFQAIARMLKIGEPYMERPINLPP